MSWSLSKRGENKLLFLVVADILRCSPKPPFFSSPGIYKICSETKTRTSVFICQVGRSSSTPCHAEGSTGGLGTQGWGSQSQHAASHVCHHNLSIHPLGRGKFDLNSATGWGCAPEAKRWSDSDISGLGGKSLGMSHFPGALTQRLASLHLPMSLAFVCGNRTEDSQWHVNSSDAYRIPAWSLQASHKHSTSPSTTSWRRPVKTAELPSAWAPQWYRSCQFKTKHFVKLLPNKTW